ncbi:MAG TPA: hypothetical protein VHZ51_15980, partial [Ktedonobacteraceae bacterium]|nr:hypothetical protein [Ktedonobacteraceae bacterium]
MAKAFGFSQSHRWNVPIEADEGSSRARCSLQSRWKVLNAVHVIDWHTLGQHGSVFTPGPFAWELVHYFAGSVQENYEIILTQEGKSGNPATLSARFGLASLPGAE